MCPRCGSRDCVCGFGKPLVMICSGCSKIKKFGKYVKSEFSIEYIKRHYEIVQIVCDDCQAGLAGIKPLYP